MFNVDFDDDAGLIECRCEGHLTVADVVVYGELMRSVVDRANRAGPGGIRVLVHANSAVQTAEVMEAVTQHTWQPGPGDRMAFIVLTTLAKLQAARLFDPARARPFLTEADARAWLTEDDLGRVARPVRAGEFAQAKAF